MFRIIAALVAACLFASPVRAAPVTDLDRRLDAVLEQQRAELHLPGLAFAVVRDGRVVYARALGYRDVEAKAPATLDTVFPIGSATKSFTSMAVALEQDRGRLSLGDHPRAWLPWFRLRDPDADAKVTLRAMLSHRAGLRANADLAAEPGVLTREDYVRAATSAVPAAPFGAKFEYSNAMFVAAGEIAGRTEDSSWEQVIRTRIFQPLGMTSAVARLDELSRRPDHATGYLYDPAAGSFRPVPPPRSLDALAPAGAIGASARDMVRWLTMLTGRGVIDGRRFVSAAALNELTTPQIAVNERFSYALGWAAYDWNGFRVIEHNGGSQGISALVSWIPEKRLGFVFLANTSPNRMTQIGNAAQLLYPLLLGEGPQDAPITAAPPPAPAASASLDALLQRAAAALGDAAAIRRHASIEITGTKAYLSQGVSGPATILARAPAARVEDETWIAAGREIGRLRIWFDGRHGAQETTFGQDAANDAAADAAALRNDDFRPLLHLRGLYPEIALQAPVMLAGEPADVLRLKPPDGPEVTLSLSQRDGRLLRRQEGATTTDYADYRPVDGERVPFIVVTHDALGDTVFEAASVRFDPRLPDTAFGPRK